ncbi:MAG: hypothetical protein Q7K39_01090 [Candidatus Magasanikbacteria bacterium]|nr:hypothetical protein [Candidatus Magasanikbacteria bacterium]
MTLPNLDKIEIVEPPIQELTTKPSVWKRAALLGCGGLLLVLIILFVSIKIALGPGPETLRAVPASFPSNIPIYDKENIETITYIPGRYKNRAVEIAALFPKIILAPLFISLDDNAVVNTTTVKTNSGFSAKKLWRVIATPVSNAHDTVQIEWHRSSAGPKFVYSYYQSELKKKKFTIESETHSPGFRQFSFKNATVSGFFAVRGESEETGADYMVLTVNIAPSANLSSPALK